MQWVCRLVDFPLIFVVALSRCLPHHFDANGNGNRSFRFSSQYVYNWGDQRVSKWAGERSSHRDEGDWKSSKDVEMEQEEGEEEEEGEQHARPQWNGNNLMKKVCRIGDGAQHEARQIKATQAKQQKRYGNYVHMNIFKLFVVPMAQQNQRFNSYRWIIAPISCLVVDIAESKGERHRGR